MDPVLWAYGEYYVPIFISDIGSASVLVACINCLGTEISLTHPREPSSCACCRVVDSRRFLCGDAYTDV